MNVLLGGKTPAVPPIDKSILHGPLWDANRRCGLKYRVVEVHELPTVKEVTCYAA